MLRVKVELDRSPLRYTFVSHRPDFGDPVVAMSDGEGWASFDDIDARSKVDIVVHSHNLAVRMLDGENPGVSEVALRFKNKGDGATLNISPKNKHQFPYYRIMDQCYSVYETVFASMPPFKGQARQAFPHANSTKSAAWHRANPAVDCRYPETLVPGKLPWVQPQSITTGVPLMHLKGPSQDRKLFGTKDRPATTIAHEYAHALHFSQLKSLQRWELAAKYALWIGTELANGRSGTHRTNKKTSPLIAYIEAIGIFSQRFWLYATQVEPDLDGAALHVSFINDELSKSPSLADVMPGYCPIASRTRTGTVKPSLKGDATEGAVYGAIFLDFASQTSLSTAVHSYLTCGSFNADGWSNAIARRRRGHYAEAVASVGSTWRL